MAGFNKVVMMGNLCAMPELKQTPTGVSVTSFAIGVQRRAKNADGTYGTDFIQIVAWRQTAEFICKNFSKGDPILISGAIQTRSWQDDKGNKRHATEVVADEVTFCGRKSSNAVPMPGDADTPRAVEHPQKAPDYVPGSATAAAFEEIYGDDGLPY